MAHKPLLNSDGSAEWSISHGQGVWKHTTRAIASFNGPIQAMTRDELPTKASIEVVYRPSIGLVTLRESLLREHLVTTVRALVNIDEYPRQKVSLVCQSLEAGEPVKEFSCHELAAAINVSVLAMVTAGISMSSMAAAVVCAVLKDGSLKLNPSVAELKESRSNHVFAFKYWGGPEEPTSALFIVESQGLFTEDELVSCMNRAREGCYETYLDLRTEAEKLVAGAMTYKN